MWWLASRRHSTMRLKTGQKTSWTAPRATAAENGSEQVRDQLFFHSMQFRFLVVLKMLTFLCVFVCKMRDVRSHCR